MFEFLSFQKKAVASRDQSKQYEAPDIFVTEEYLQPVLQVEKTVTQSVTNSNQSNKIPSSDLAESDSSKTDENS